MSQVIIQKMICQCYFQYPNTLAAIKLYILKILKVKRLEVHLIKKILLILIIFNLSPINAQTTIDTINSINNKLIVSSIKESKKEYLVYLADSNKNRINIGDIWKRTIKFDNVNGKKIIEFGWEWYIKNGKLYKTVTNLCDAKTLSPIYHKTFSNSTGDSRYDRELGIKAYDFVDNKMIPSDSVKDNIVAGKEAVNLDIPTLSWELDLEIFELLPIKSVGQKFAISFFDPSENKPDYHLYEVTGKELLKLNIDTVIECWILFIKYDESNYAKFWLTQNSHEAIKMEEYFNGFFRIKELLFK